MAAVESGSGGFADGDGALLAAGKPGHGDVEREARTAQGRDALPLRDALHPYQPPRSARPHQAPGAVPSVYSAADGTHGSADGPTGAAKTAALAEPSLAEVASLVRDQTFGRCSHIWQGCTGSTG